MSHLRQIAGIAALLLSFAAPQHAWADDFIFGTGAHFAFNPKRGYLPETQRPHIADLGVSSFRDDILEGAFTVTEPDHPLGRQLDRLNTMLLERGPRAVLILKGRQLAKTPVLRDAPTSPREIEMFANFATRVVSATKAFNPIYEIWNEWNMGWRPRQPVMGPLGLRSENPDYSPENYVEVARATYQAIKATSPAALVLTGSIGDDEGWEWSKRAMKAGLAKTGDGISVHFYNHCNPPPRRTAENLIEKVESFHKAIQEAGTGTLPLYITEFGWPNDQGPCGIPHALAAANLAQFALWAPTRSWIKGIWTYELRNSGINPMDREDNFGLYDYDNVAKPAVCMYREAIKLSRSLTDATFRQTQPGIRWLEGKTAQGRTIWVIWTTGRDARAAIRYRDGSAVTGKALCDGKNAASSVEELTMAPLVVEPGEKAADSLVVQLKRP